MPFPESKSLEQTGNSDMLNDDPCWGSQSQCDLPYLISQYPKEACLVYESPYYVVINKPPDLRMDGPYLSTVHKLLTYWFPPPSIANEPNLLDRISSLHQHNSLKDNSLRPCHQLDYATSGLLCLARTREAARFAIRQWEQRSVRKIYLAVVEADLTQMAHLSEMQRWTSERVRENLRRLEKDYKKTRKPDKKSRDKATFEGFHPVHSMFQKYKGMLESSCEKPSKKRKRAQTEVLTSEQWDHIWQPVNSLLTQESKDGCSSINATKISEEVRKVIQSVSWKEIACTRPEWKAAFEQATDRHNDLLREILLQKSRNLESEGGPAVDFPTIFEEDSGGSSKVIYVFCPLAEDPHTFSMRVPQVIGSQYPHMKALAGDVSKLDFKPSLTKCTILKTTERDGKICTKVELLPLTGRRHQLRVHMALLAGNGSGIAGDATYNGHTVPLTELRKTAPTIQPKRMCLHSHKLSLRLLVDEESGKNENVCLVAPDPFLLAPRSNQSETEDWRK